VACQDAHTDGDYGPAREALDAQLSLNASDWRFYYQYALLARATGESEKSLSMLNRASAYLEESGKVYIDLAKTWYALGMDDRSLRCLEKAEGVIGQGTNLFADVERLKASIIKEKETP
jgi:tetratricopeptide (TPR) repeat protein